MVTALDVANTFLQQGFQDNVEITPMKLQKLVYIFYKTYLKRTGQKLFTETFGAWQKGPVVPIIYSEFKQYRGNPITQYSLNNNGKAFVVDFSNFDDLRDIYNDVWETYKGIDALKLSELTHKKGGAWEKAVNNQTYLLQDEDIKAEEDYLQ